jgi:diaminopimelate epimerase
MSLPFLKMHGLGNDFVVIDARKTPFDPNPAQRRAIADRRTGVGCDQLILLEPPPDPSADVFMRIYNPDGSEAGACGNATRCVAWLEMERTGGDRAVVQTVSGLLPASRDPGGLITVDMGPARLDWQDVPLAAEADTLRLPIAPEGLEGPCAVSMGNPHAVFFVEDAEAVPLEVLGPRIEHHPLFPERTNVEVAQVLSPSSIRLRVWERGAGITRACGSGACATMVAAVRRGLTGRSAEIRLDGGTLRLSWGEDGRVRMTGPAATSFSGILAEDLLRE